MVWPVAQWSVHSGRLLQDLGALADFSFVGSKKPLQRKPGASLLSLAAVSQIACLAHGFLAYPGIWLNASFCWHLLLIWWVNIGLRFSNGNEHSPRRIYQQEVEPHFYEPFIIQPLSYMIFHVLGRFDSPPHARTPKKNKSGQPRKTT